MHPLAQVPEGIDQATIDSDGGEKLRISRGGSIPQRPPPIEDEQLYDCSRPKAHGVGRSISAALRRNNVCGRELIDGDITVAFPFGRAFDVSAQKIQREIRKRHRGATALKIAARSGYGYSGFAAMIGSFPQNSTDIYDVRLVAGGWNDDRLDRDTASQEADRVRALRNLYRHPKGGDTDGYFCIKARPPHRAETNRDTEMPITKAQRGKVIAYTSLGGMDGPGEEADKSHLISLHIMNISDVIDRRLKVDPLGRITRRRDQPTMAHYTVLHYIDDVAAEVDSPCHDDDADLSAYVRVCCVVKSLYGQLRPDTVNQCVIEERFAICIIGRVSRAYDDGVCRWREPAWGKLDGMGDVTRDMKYEWKRCIVCVAGFVFSIASTGVERKRIPVLTAPKQSHKGASMGGGGVLDWWPNERCGSVAEKGKRTCLPGKFRPRRTQTGPQSRGYLHADWVYRRGIIFSLSR